MASKITQAPGLGGQQTPGPSRLNLDAGDTGAIQQNISAIQIQEGQRIQQLAEKYFNETDNIFKDGQYNEAVMGATKEFNAAYQERLSNIRDGKGNVNIKDIPADIDKLSQDILQKYTRNILDPGVNQRVSNQFGYYTLNKGIEAMSAAAAAQEKFARQSFESNYADTLELVKSDPAQAETHIAVLEEQMQSGISKGYLNPTTAHNQLRSLKRGVREEQFYGQLRTNPEAALKWVQDQQPDGIADSHDLLIWETAAKSDISQEHSAKAAQVTTAITEVKDKLSKGEYLNKSEIQSLDTIKKLDPKKADDIDSLINKSIVSQTLNVANADNRSKYMTEILSDPNVTTETKEIVRDVNKGITEKINSDPVLAFIQNSPDTNIQELNPKDQSFIEQLAYRNSRSGAITDYTGKSNVLATKAEIDQIQAVWDEGDLNDRSKLLSDITVALKSDSSKLLSQLSKDGDLPALGQMAANGQESTVRKILKGQEYSKRDPNSLKAVSDPQTIGFYRILNNAGIPETLDPAERQSKESLAKDLFAYTVANNPKLRNSLIDMNNQEAKSAYIRGLQQINGGTPILYNGSLISRPNPTITDAKFDDWIDSIQASDLPGEVYGIGTDNFLEGLKNREYRLVDNGPGSYGVIETMPTGDQMVVYNANTKKPLILNYNKINQRRIK